VLFFRVCDFVPQYRYIESIRTSAKTVICSKISPKFDRVPTTDILPVSDIISIINMLRYVLHICNQDGHSQMNLNA